MMKEKDESMTFEHARDCLFQERLCPRSFGSPKKAGRKCISSYLTNLITSLVMLSFADADAVSPCLSRGMMRESWECRGTAGEMTRSNKVKKSMGHISSPLNFHLSRRSQLFETPKHEGSWGASTLIPTVMSAALNKGRTSRQVRSDLWHERLHRVVEKMEKIRRTKCCQVINILPSEDG